jgi:hypothetical protein
MAASSSGEGHRLPEERVVPVTAAVVAHGVTRFGDLREQRLERQPGECGRGRDGLVEVVDVSLVMLAVVDLHRALVDDRRERVVGIGQRPEGEALCGCTGSAEGEQEEQDQSIAHDGAPERGGLTAAVRNQAAGEWARRLPIR